MCSSSKTGVNGLGLCLDLVSNIVERLEGGFITDGSDVSSLKAGVLIINRTRNDGSQRR